MAVGMGQMETKVFPAMFPDDFEASVEALLRAETLLVVETHCYIPHQQFPSPGRNTREDRPPHVLTGRYILWLIGREVPLTQHTFASWV